MSNAPTTNVVLNADGAEPQPITVKPVVNHYSVAANPILPPKNPKLKTAVQTITTSSAPTTNAVLQTDGAEPQPTIVKPDANHCSVDVTKVQSKNRQRLSTVVHNTGTPNAPMTSVVRPLGIVELRRITAYHRIVSLALEGVMLPRRRLVKAQSIFHDRLLGMFRMVVLGCSIVERRERLL